MAGKTNRRWFRFTFSLRALFVLVTVAALLMVVVKLNLPPHRARPDPRFVRIHLGADATASDLGDILAAIKAKTGLTKDDVHCMIRMNGGVIHVEAGDYIFKFYRRSGIWRLEYQRSVFNEKEFIQY